VKAKFLEINHDEMCYIIRKNYHERIDVILILENDEIIIDSLSSTHEMTLQPTT
jgi:hypothetical protein